MMSSCSEQAFSLVGNPSAFAVTGLPNAIIIKTRAKRIKKASYPIFYESFAGELSL
jgi:hypothetical protein